LGIPVVYLDLDKPETIAPALEGIERVFMVTGYTNHRAAVFLRGAASEGILP
jgi:uncharacterized protein YbjT (DUF2867 family)